MSPKATVDLAGRRFGMLRVIELAEPYIIPKTGHTQRQWRCQCDCGTELVVLQSNLTRVKNPVNSCKRCAAERQKRTREAKGEWLSAGDVYGKIKLLSYEYRPAKKEGNPPVRLWTCECLNCEKKFKSTGQLITKKGNDIGCPDCRAAFRKKQSEEEARTHIGKEYGALKVLDVGDYKGHSWAMICECKNCGSVTEISLNRLKKGGALQCKYCGRKNLELGQELMDIATVNGSSVYNVLPSRKLNKNNTTGVKGVCYSSKTGMYRAYIMFRRHQYPLGTYAKLEDAAAARKAGEEKIHGGFLEWYKETYPDRWARLGIKEDDIPNDT